LELRVRVREEWHGLILLRLGLAKSGDVLATPRSLCQCAQGVYVQQGVEVAESDEHRNVHHVHRVAAEVRDQPDDLREENPDEEQSPAQRLRPRRAWSQNLGQEPGETDVDEERRVLEHREVYDVASPSVLAGAPVGLVAHDREVAAEASAGPSQALVDVARVLLECRLQADSSLNNTEPTPRKKIPTGRFVVITVQLFAAEGCTVAQEVVVEVLALKDFSTPSGCAAG